MSISFVSVKCPSCGGQMSLEEGHRETFCPYCRSQILVNDENDYTYRVIDEAEIKQAETDRMVRLKEMELEQANRSRKIKIALGLLAVGIIMMAGGYLLGDYTEDSDSGFYMVSMIGMFPMFGALFMLIDSFGNKKE